jgi:hypothetical protein
LSLDGIGQLAGMGHMKDYDLRIRQGGDDAIAAVSELIREQEAEIERLREQIARRDAPLTHQPDVQT